MNILGVSEILQNNLRHHTEILARNAHIKTKLVEGLHTRCLLSNKGYPKTIAE